MYKDPLVHATVNTTDYPLGTMLWDIHRDDTCQV